VAHASLGATGVGPDRQLLADQSARFIGLACPTRSQCTAVAEGGEAVTFRPTSPTRPPRTEVDNLAPVNAIACPSADQCTLVDSSGVEVTFNPRAPHDRSSQEIDGNGFLFGLLARR
jgi:hypothetical protein